MARRLSHARNLAGGEERSAPYAGGVAEGWKAPALDASNPAARRWTAGALYSYLRTGLSPDHGAAAGPMAPITEDSSRVPDDDVRAIAIYITSKMGNSSVSSRPAPSRGSVTADAASPAGATLFAGACAGCHGPGTPMAAQGRPSLALASDLRDDDPTNTIQAILGGIEPPVADRGPSMLGFADSFTDAQITATAVPGRRRDGPGTDKRRACQRDR